MSDPVPGNAPGESCGRPFNVYASANADVPPDYCELEPGHAGDHACLPLAARPGPVTAHLDKQQAVSGPVPGNVPDEAIEAVARLLYKSHNLNMGWGADVTWESEPEGYRRLWLAAARPYVAVVLPVVRRRLAEQINALKSDLRADDFNVVRNIAYARAARVVRGDP